MREPIQNASLRAMMSMAGTVIWLRAFSSLLLAMSSWYTSKLVAPPLPLALGLVMSAAIISRALPTTGLYFFCTE
ncbi:MAG TPA: hypothetical protein DEQ17_00040 [Prevotella sp.]|nr:hypothetical protein [Prevotella sp.]